MLADRVGKIGKRARRVEQVRGDHRIVGDRARRTTEASEQRLRVMRYDLLRTVPERGKSLTDLRNGEGTRQKRNAGAIGGTDTELVAARNEGDPFARGCFL